MAIFYNPGPWLAYVCRYLFMWILVFVKYKLETKNIEFCCNKGVALF